MLVFFSIHFIPGDVIDVMMGSTVSPNVGEAGVVMGMQGSKIPRAFTPTIWRITKWFSLHYMVTMS